MCDKKSKVDDLCEKFEFINIKWWDNFEDPHLKSYIIKSIQNNHEAKKASWQSEEYRQFVKTNFAKELPSFSVSTAYLGINSPSINGSMEVAENAFILPFFMKYEADLLLKSRDKTKSSYKNYEAAKSHEKTAYIMLASNVGTTYINIIRYDKSIALLKRVCEINKEILKRESDKYKRGVSSATELNNAINELEESKNRLDEAATAREKLLNQFAVFLGDVPECKNTYLRNDIDIFDYKKNIPTEICSDKIFSRPDVIATEKLLEKAKIDIRICKKDFFPSFNILGIYAFNTIGTGNFFSWEAVSATLIASATQDIFKGGLKLANLRISKARYEQLFEDFKQTDLTALKEVNDSLFITKQDTKIDNQTLHKLLKETDNFNRNKKRLCAGVISKTDFLLSEKRLIAVKLEKNETKTTRIIDYITLYKSVGADL